MKKLLLITCIVLSFCSSKAQILPLENLVDYIEQGEGIPENTTHVKDINNILNQYVGTWKGTFNNKNYEFIFYKTTIEFTGTLWDRLNGYYKIIDGNGNVIEDTTYLNTNNDDISTTSEDYLVIKGRYISEGGGSYVLSYVGRQGNCGQAGDIFISVGWDNNPNKMKLAMEPKRDLIGNNCPENTPQIIPTEQFTLIKQ